MPYGKNLSKTFLKERERSGHYNGRTTTISGTRTHWQQNILEGTWQNLVVIKIKKYADLRLSVLGFIFFLPCLGGIFQEENPGENWIESQ